MTVRVRYPPSPTGLQHIGGVRTALFNYLYARVTGGTFVLRIEDTDQNRYDPAAVDDLYETLEWLGIKWDEGPEVGGDYGPYVQTERSHLYREHAERLIQSGHAYRAYDTPEELQALRDAGKEYDRRFRDLSPEDQAAWEAKGVPSVVRFKIPLEGSTSISDLVYGDISWENADIPIDPILLKSDGLPTYHLANVVDDHHMQISHIMRGPEWLPSAPLHVLLYRAFGWTPPTFCHLPLVVGEDGQKLSKRHGATRVLEFRQRGYLPEAIINYLARVGWSYDDKTEIFSLDELERIFSVDKISKSPATFDYKKLEWINGHYIRELSTDELYERILPFLQSDDVVESPPTADQERVVRGAVPLIQERLKYLSDASAQLRFLFVDPVDFDIQEMIPKKLDAKKTADLFEQILPMVQGAADRTDEENEALFRARAEELETKLGNILMPLRVSISGSRVSPPLFGSIRQLGGEEAFTRAERALRRLKESL